MLANTLHRAGSRRPHRYRSRRVGTRLFGVVAAMAATLAAAPVGPAHAAVYCGIEGTLTQNVYVGPNGGSWTTALNWSSNVVPSGGGNVCVPGGKIVHVPDNTSMVGGVVDQVASLRIEGTVRIDAGAQVATNHIYGGASFVNGGVIQVQTGATLTIAPDQNGAPAFQITSDGGRIEVAPGGTLALQRPMSNNGTIDLTGGGRMLLNGQHSAYAGQGRVIGGTVRLTAGTVGFGGNGALNVVATGAAATGTIGSNQSLAIVCDTYSTATSFPSGLTNNGTFRMLPPLAGNCGVEMAFGSGTTFTNNGSFVVGDAAAPRGWGYFGTSPYASNGELVNGPTGTMTINDHFINGLNRTTNHGTVNVTAAGVLQQVLTPYVNHGTIVIGNGCDLYDLTNTGVLDLVRPCTVRGAAVLGSTSVLRVHSSAAELTKVSGMSKASTIAGRVDVVTDAGNPPALGTIRDVFSAPASGQFASVTASGPVGYVAVYPPSSGGLAQLQAVAAPAGGGGGGGGSAIDALVPGRLLDTRQGGATVDGQSQGSGALDAGTTVVLPVAGRGGVPVDAVAAVLNVTVAAAEAPGFITVYPCGAQQPNASNLNYVAGSTVPNGVIAKIGDGGAVCIYTSSPTQLLVDVAGYFTGGSPYRPLVPGRLFDSREGGATVDGVGQAGGVRGAGTVTEVQVTGRAGVPADAVAAVLNVTVTGAEGDGYVTVYPCGTEPPNASNLNFVAGSTIPNNVVAKIGDGGTVCLYTSAPTQLIVDVAGYFVTSPSYAALVPGRLFDSREGGATVDGVGQGGGVRGAGTVTEVSVTGRAGVPADAVAAVLNVTVTGAEGDGYVTVYPCGTEPPNASNLNFVAGSTIPNGVIVKIGDGGKVCLYTSAPTHLIADVAGFFAA